MIDEASDSKNKMVKIKAMHKLIEFSKVDSYIQIYFVPNFQKIMVMIVDKIFRPLPNLKQKEIDALDDLTEEADIDE